MWPIAAAFVFAGSWLGFEIFSVLTSRHFDVVTRAGIGSLLGVVLSAWLVFITNLWLPLTVTHGLLHGLFLLIAGSVIRVFRRKVESPKALPVKKLVGSILVPVSFLSVMFHLGFLNRGVITKGSCYGDLPFHMNIVSSFVYGCNQDRKSLFGLESPFFAHQQLAYPFIPDFYSAVLLSCFDVSYHSAFVIPSFVPAFALFAVLAQIVNRFTSYEMACYIAPWLFLLSGGLGFMRYLDPVVRNEFNVDYVHNWGSGRREYWFQTVIHILMPQRASLFSLPLAFAIILMLMSYGGLCVVDIRAFMAVGIVVGALPQVQPHSVIAAAEWGVVNFLIVFPWLQCSRWIPIIVNYLVLGVTAIVMGIPQVLPFVSRLETPFMKIATLWSGQSDKAGNFLTLWLYALGIFFVLSMLVGFFMLSKQQLKWYTPSVVVFIVANFIWYQPWHLDNTKVFNAAWMPLAVAVVAHILARIWTCHRFIGRTIALVLFCGCVASGTLAVAGAARLDFPLWSRDDSPYVIAKYVRGATPVDSVWITDSWHAHPVITLAGRRTIAGYPGWLVSHGISDKDRKIAMRRLERNPEDTGGVDELGVDYACVRTNSDFKFQPSESSKSWQAIYKSSRYAIYKRTK